MNYDYGLIHFENILSSDHEMYSLILLDTRNITFIMNGIRCYLSGKYILCLSNDDVIKGVSGVYAAHTFRYLPYFINVNLSHEIIGNPLYESMRAEHRYPDFHLFRKRDSDFIGIISLTESEYETARLYFDRSARYIEAHDTDLMWSCRTRSDLFSILNIAESAFCGTDVKEENDIIRWIKDNAGRDKKLSLNTLCEQFHMSRTTVANTVHALTGMSPMAYVLEERLKSDLNAEYQAIRRYRDHISRIDDPNIQALLKRIILDEEVHVLLFKEAIQKYVEK
jgi:hypothetical protein